MPEANQQKKVTAGQGDLLDNLSVINESVKHLQNSVLEFQYSQGKSGKIRECIDETITILEQFKKLF